MNSATTKPQSSNQNRWLVLAGVIFVIQLALVWLMGEHWQASAPTRVPAPVGLLPKALSDDQIADNIFASHPTLFPEPSRHGFSGGAWLHGPSQAYTTPERNEPEHWLKLPTDRLATTLPAIAPKGSDVPFELAAQNDPAVEASNLGFSGTLTPSIQPLVKVR